tara:strand:+ start:962 stop:1795 length:834 start_codon:yes stop_codon:yes gene_type:complete
MSVISKKRVFYEISNFLDTNLNSNTISLQSGQEIISIFKNNNNFCKYTGWIINIENLSNNKFLIKIIYDDGDECDEIYNIKELVNQRAYDPYLYCENNFKKQKYINPYNEYNNINVDVPTIMCKFLNANNRKYYKCNKLYYKDKIINYLLRINETAIDTNKFYELYIGKIKNSDVLWYKINYDVKWSQLCFSKPVELNDEGIDKIKIKSIDNVKEGKGDILRTSFDNLVEKLFDIYAFNFDLIAQILKVKYDDIKYSLNRRFLDKHTYSFLLKKNVK